jgi:hypothetical protein
VQSSHLDDSLPRVQIVIAVMYFTRWHVSSEFLSVAIAAQVTRCVHDDSHFAAERKFYGLTCTSTGVQAVASVQCCAFAWFSSIRRAVSAFSEIQFSLELPDYISGAPTILAHPILGTCLPATEQQVPLSLGLCAGSMIHGIPLDLSSSLLCRA